MHKRKLGKCYATFVLVSLSALCDGGVLLSCRKHSLMYQSRSMITGPDPLSAALMIMSVRRRSCLRASRSGVVRL